MKVIFSPFLAFFVMPKLRNYGITAPLQRPIGIRREDTVLKNKVLAITQRLRTGDAAADKPEVLRIPAEVLAFQIGVIDGDVLAVPERIFRIEHGITDLDITGVLEGVLALQLEINNLELLRLEEGIVPLLYAQISNLSAATTPESLSAIGHPHAFNSEPVYLSKSLWRIERAVRQFDAANIPHRRPVRCREMAFHAHNILALPEDVHAFEAAVYRLHTTAFLQPRFAFADGDITELNIAALIQRPLTVIILVGDEHMLVDHP